MPYRKVKRLMYENGFTNIKKSAPNPGRFTPTKLKPLSSVLQNDGGKKSCPRLFVILGNFNRRLQKSLLILGQHQFENAIVVFCLNLISVYVFRQYELACESSILRFN